jgi:outer membrane protein insertion porin family
MSILRSRRACVLLCLAATSVFAQQYTVKKIVFTGTTPYSQASLEAASGLKPGDTISQADLQAAAQRLVDTGAFDDLQSTLDGPVKAITVIFKIKPVDPSRILTATFDNFVWFQSDELKTKLQKLVPLFNGTVPEAGNQDDAIVAALKQMLKEKGVDATVTFEPVAPSPMQPLRLAEFRAAKPAVRIRSVVVTGGTPGLSPATDKLVHALNGRNYNEGLIPASLPNLLLGAYKDAGYQASSLSTLKRIVAASTGTGVDVDVAATILSGDVYRLSKLEWAGSPMMSAEGFAAEASLHPGDIASQKSLLESLGKLEAAYRNKGYMDVVVTATPQLDDAAHQVAFTVAVIPGEQYKLRQVTPVGLSAAQQADFDKAWKLHPGDVFDEGYASSFLQMNSALQSFNGYSAKFKTIADPDTHTVELVMTFIKGGAIAH